ncbi:MAG: hypothetical protein ACRD29_03525 [Acidimicrobiales bacterium]
MSRRVAAHTERWFQGTGRRLALGRTAWDTPAVVAVAESWAAGADPLPALRRLGEERAAAGMTLDEVLDDLAEAVSVLPRYRRRRLRLLELAAAVGTGWADGVGHLARSAGCVDPLTGLPTVGYLTTRLDEVYRHCEALGLWAPDLYRFVVVQLDDELPSVSGLARTVEVALLLQDAFPGGEIVARVSRLAYLALASNTPTLPMRVDRLREQLTALLVRSGAVDGPTTDTAPAGPGVHLWLERLEPEPAATRLLLQELTHLRGAG